MKKYKTENGYPCIIQKMNRYDRDKVYGLFSDDPCFSGEFNNKASNFGFKYGYSCDKTESIKGGAIIEIFDETEYITIDGFPCEIETFYQPGFHYDQSPAPCIIIHTDDPFSEKPFSEKWSLFLRPRPTNPNYKYSYSFTSIETAIDREYIKKRNNFVVTKIRNKIDGTIHNIVLEDKYDINKEYLDFTWEIYQIEKDGKLFTIGDVINHYSRITEIHRDGSISGIGMTPPKTENNFKILKVRSTYNYTIHNYHPRLDPNLDPNHLYWELYQIEKNGKVYTIGDISYDDEGRATMITKITRSGNVLHTEAKHLDKIINKFKILKVRSTYNHTISDYPTCLSPHHSCWEPYQIEKDGKIITVGDIIYDEQHGYIMVKELSKYGDIIYTTSLSLPNNNFKVGDWFYCIGTKEVGIITKETNSWFDTVLLHWKQNTWGDWNLCVKDVNNPQLFRRATQKEIDECLLKIYKEGDWVLVDIDGVPEINKILYISKQNPVTVQLMDNKWIVLTSIQRCATQKEIDAQPNKFKVGDIVYNKYIKQVYKITYIDSCCIKTENGNESDSSFINVPDAWRYATPEEREEYLTSNNYFKVGDIIYNKKLHQLFKIHWFIDLYTVTIMHTNGNVSNIKYCEFLDRSKWRLATPEENLDYCCCINRT